MIEMALGVTVDDLIVRYCSVGDRIPVHHAVTVINEAFLVEIYESGDDGGAELGIHCELGAVPVAGRAEFAQLLEDNAAVLLFPRPGVLEELLAGEVFLADSLRGKACDHLALRSYGGVVGTWHPAGVLAVHAGFADEYVVKGIVEHVTHVKDTCHIGRRNYDCIGGPGIGLRVKTPVL